MERYRTKSAVFALLLRHNQEEVLLQQRFQTGIGDGHYDLAAGGHVEAQESMKQALVRELHEELDLTVKPANLEFATLIHANYGDDTVYYCGYFVVKDYQGTPLIAEPDQASQLDWYSVHDLPHNLLWDRRRALENYQRGIPYDEVGWHN
ncbi:NUDIX domain-containing protein [Fructilactobacillus cliffordii]|uniref:NUDIX domain-containing protein n=1 Tax=Fructilactobacillus cliffordii TaxID=2940299 RepID=A0A9Q8ZPC6_9LACO|nr:NUDIX domain-containing protein [Fructilactobacillus cliffordii]USS89110.1 NUDIX domain-containing protein [Fructilactobacillus cliffordii]